MTSLRYPASIAGLIEALQDLNTTIASLSIGSSGIPDGDYGDIVVSSDGTTWTIDLGAITQTKLQTGVTLPAPVLLANPGYTDDSLKVPSTGWTRNLFEPFGAYRRNANQAFGNAVWATAIWDTIDAGASYLNLANGVITVPETGWYLIVSNPHLVNGSSSGNTVAYTNIGFSTGEIYYNSNAYPGPLNFYTSQSIIKYMTSGTTFYIQGYISVDGGGTHYFYAPYTNMQFMKLPIVLP